ncbi:MAG: HTH-type transcriptional regulator SinR [Dehalococcoidia bacterium]|nr:HTH-type transcriptional regulator SinR [Chloroflexota bacterium]
MVKQTGDSIQNAFGRRIKTLRGAKGLSHEELAFRARVHRTYLGAIERGERNPSLKNIAAIARALDIKLSELFDFTLPQEKIG